MRPVTIVIDGVAVAKGRPRMTRKGFMYTPSAIRKYDAHDRRYRHRRRRVGGRDQRDQKIRAISKLVVTVTALPAVATNARAAA